MKMKDFRNFLSTVPDDVEVIYYDYNSAMFKDSFNPQTKTAWKTLDGQDYLIELNKGEIEIYKEEGVISDHPRQVLILDY